MNASANAPVLYYSAFCFFCQKVLMFMRKNNIELETRSTSERTHYETLAKGGGRTQVPCLLIQSDSEPVWMYESDDIINYLRERYC